MEKLSVVIVGLVLSSASLAGSLGGSGGTPAVMNGSIGGGGGTPAVEGGGIGVSGLGLQGWGTSGGTPPAVMSGSMGGGGLGLQGGGVGGGTPPAVMGGSLGGGGGTPAVEAFNGQTGGGGGLGLQGGSTGGGSPPALMGGSTGGGGAGLCSDDAQLPAVSVLAPNLGIVSGGLPAQVLPTLVAAISMQYRSHADVCEATEN